MRNRNLACTCVLAVALSACSDPVEPLRLAVEQPGRSASDILNTPSPNADQRFIDAANIVEGFGGFFFDADGTPTVYLKKPADASRVDGQLRVMFLEGSTGAGNPAANNRAIRYRTAKYDFKQLAGFAAVAGRFLDQEKNAVSLDIDEAQNRVALTVSDIGSQVRLIEKARVAGVPEDALVVDLERPSLSMVAPGDSLNSRFDPIPGGVMIFDTSYCTLGFTLNWGGRSAFVTASHCTERFAAITPTLPMGQPSGGQSLVVATEVADPRPWQNTSDCLFSRAFEGVDVCRYSDAAVFQAHDSLANSRFAVGYIARVTGYLNSNVVDQSNPRWEITGKKNPVYVGETMERMGVVTFWTSGQITNTCITQYQTMPDGQSAKLWCQHKMAAVGIPGDSGGPVFFRLWCGIFQYRPDGTECVTLAGIAHTSANNNTRVIFSPMSGIDTDFGTTQILPSNQP